MNIAEMSVKFEDNIYISSPDNRITVDRTALFLFCLSTCKSERLCLYKLILAVPSFFFLLTLIGGLINGSYSTVFFSLLLVLTNIALYICSKVVLSKKRQKIISKIKKRYL